MAALSMTRSGFGDSQVSRKAEIADADMTALLAERRDAIGKPDMTDDEVTVLMFDAMLRTLIEQASVNIREKAARVAADSVQAIQVTVSDDVKGAEASPAEARLTP